MNTTAGRSLEEVQPNIFFHQKMHSYAAVDEPSSMFTLLASVNDSVVSQPLYLLNLRQKLLEEVFLKKFENTVFRNL